MTADASVVRRLYEAREREDIDTSASLLAPDVQWHEPYDYLGTIHGREAVLEAIRHTLDETGGGFRLHLTDVLASDDHVVALVDFEAERDGQRLSGREVGVFRVADGLIQEVWFYAAEDPQIVNEFLRGD
ncbi:MAG: nuclear transport factor 2 family protein [Candidatus Limnocylindrales bacterium]